MANPFIADAGPEFDPDQAPAVETPVLEEPALQIGWQPARVKRIVRAQGVATHELLGVGEEDWLWRPAELEAISEPLAEMLNRYPVTHAAAMVSDELTVGAVMLEYSLRSIRERTRVLRARQAAEAEAARPTGASYVQRETPVGFDTGFRPDDVEAVPATPVPDPRTTTWSMPDDQP